MFIKEEVKIMKNASNMYYGIIRMSNNSVKALSRCVCRCFGLNDDEQIENMGYNVASSNYA